MAKIEDLTAQIDTLAKSIATLQSEIAEMQTQLKRAGEDRAQGTYIHRGAGDI